MHGAEGCGARHKNAPSRLRPRPTFRLTTAEATTTRRAINLGHSVLGASGTLWTRRLPVKHLFDRIRRNLRQVPLRPPLLPSTTNRLRTTTKCTEPVASSSGFPTDRRRSDNHSESHQPWTLRTRCIADSRGRLSSRQGIEFTTCRKLRFFLFTTATLRPPLCALGSKGKEKRAGHEGPAARVRRAGNAFVHLPDEPSASA
jgi:hypothetical protein